MITTSPWSRYADRPCEDCEGHYTAEADDDGTVYWVHSDSGCFQGCDGCGAPYNKPCECEE